MKMTYVLSGLALLSSVSSFANGYPYTLVDTDSLNFTAPVVFDRASQTQAVAGSIVYDTQAGAFFGLTPSGNPSTPGSWVQLGGSTAGSPSVTSSYGGLVRVESATIAGAAGGSCVATETTGDWITGTPTSSGTGQCSVQINSGLFAAAPSCTITVLAGSGAGQLRTVNLTAPTTTTSVQFQTGTYSSGALSNESVEITCVGKAN